MLKNRGNFVRRVRERPSFYKHDIPFNNSFWLFLYSFLSWDWSQNFAHVILMFLSPFFIFYVAFVISSYLTDLICIICKQLGKIHETSHLCVIYSTKLVWSVNYEIPIQLHWSCMVTSITSLKKCLTSITKVWTWYDLFDIWPYFLLWSFTRPQQAYIHLQDRKSVV